VSRFLERWSRLKKAAETASTAEGIDPEKLLAELGPDSDFTVFLKEEVSEAVRRQAMKTLFTDPHFNVMDGLDIYIDDYSISDPIPDEMMATLHQMRSIVEEPQPEAPATEPPAEAAESSDILSGDGQNVPSSESAENSPSVNQ
jgi:hypothetical protein